MILLEERQAQIKALLERQGRVLSVDLARAFATSEDTIRRDLRDLAAAGVCRRVYGGALPLSSAAGPLAERRGVAAAGKARLGRAAAGLVRAGQLVFLDAGSTNLCVAEALPDDMSLTVATNAPSIAVALAGKPGLTVLVIGGRLDPVGGGTMGAKAVLDAQDLRPDLYLLGTCAVAQETGVSAFDAEEAAFKRMVAGRSGAIAVVADDGKLGTVAPHAVCAWGAIDHLVVETPASLARLAAFAGNGPTLTFAGDDQP